MNEQHPLGALTRTPDFTATNGRDELTADGR